MIETSLSYTAKSLDQFLKNKFGLSDSKVILNGIVNADGSNPLENQNKLVLSLTHLEKESNKQFSHRSKQVVNGSFSKEAPTERYNLNIMLSSNFDDYSESLKFLNAGILFFQINGLLDRNRYSDMPSDIQKLEFEMEKMAYSDTYNLWSAMGAKYSPSVVYKMWLISINPNETSGFIPPVMDVNSIINPS